MRIQTPNPVIDSDQDYTLATQAITVVSGATYQFKTKMTRTAGQMAVTLSGATTYASGYLSSGTDFYILTTFTAASTSVTVTLVGRASTSTPADAAFDDISLKEVTNHAAQGNWQFSYSGTGLPASGGSVSSGTLNLTNASGTEMYADVSMTTVNGQVYELTFGVSNNRPIVVQIGTSQGGTTIASTTITPPGVAVYTYKFTATSTTTWLRLRTTSASTGGRNFDNLSIRAITAYGAYPKQEATFDEFFAFTATSTTARSYTNQSGTLMSDLAANAPRRDYRNGKQQFRLEDARTNLCLRSEEFDNASWTKTNLTVTADTAAAPDGNTTADRLTDTGTNANHRADAANASVTSGTSYTASCYVKAETATVVQLAFWSSLFGTTVYANYDLSGGTVSATGGGVTGSGITSVGSGWYRIWVTGAATASSSNVAITIALVNNDTVAARLPSYAGSGQTLLVWGAQVEAGAFASDYIPTTSASVTRAVETCRFSPLLEAILQRSAGSMVGAPRSDERGQ